MSVNTSGSFLRGTSTSRFAPFSMKIDTMIGASGSLTAERSQSITVEALMGASGSLTGAGPTSSSLGGNRRGNSGIMQGISFNDLSYTWGRNENGRPMQVGVSKEPVSGSLNDPCLKLEYPGFWRFRWAVKSGTRTVSVQARQNSTGSFRPSVVIRANPSIGVNTDVSGSAPDGNSWTTIGPLAISPTSVGYVWVELHNNNTYYPTVGYITNSSGSAETLRPVLFDHIVTT